MLAELQHRVDLWAAADDAELSAAELMGSALAVVGTKVAVVPAVAVPEHVGRLTLPMEHVTPVGQQPRRQVGECG
jgi:hypothetical protein